MAKAVTGSPARHRGLRLRRQRLSGDKRCVAATGIPATAFQARAVAARRYAGLGQADGLPAWRQLPRRATARPHGADGLGRRPRLPLSRLPEGRADDFGGIDSAVPPAAVRRALCRATRSPRAALRIEQLGGRRRPFRKRQAGSRQRPASRLQRARLLVSGPAQDPRARDRRRHRPRHAACHCRP